MKIRYPTVLEALTYEWQSREDIERQVGGPCMSQLSRLYNNGKVLHTVDATVEPWRHLYCKPRILREVWIGKTRVGHIGAAV